MRIIIGSNYVIKQMPVSRHDYLIGLFPYYLQLLYTKILYEYGILKKSVHFNGLKVILKQNFLNKIYRIKYMIGNNASKILNQTLNHIKWNHNNRS